ncbi:MAG: PPOX class F420-dependent oxidoreductase [Chloroflexales bacterium]|nr:PPOX class F420-dependent oxidoreductase [Chloroflexales bacterium]
MTASDGTTLDLLNDHKYANLTTFRKNGAGVITPVWFARAGNQIYVMTIADSGKVKRLRNNPHALLSPSDARGKPLGGQIRMAGRLLTGAEAQVANDTLNKKYGLIKRGFDLFLKLRGSKGRQEFLAFDAAA